MSDEMHDLIARMVDDWPPLADDQRTRLAVLLRGGGAE